MKLEEYTDFNFQLDADDSKSISGYVFILNGEAVSWKSFKKQTIADSTIEVDYITASEATKEALDEEVHYEIKRSF